MKFTVICILVVFIQYTACVPVETYQKSLDSLAVVSGDSENTIDSVISQDDVQLRQKKDENSSKSDEANDSVEHKSDTISRVSLSTGNLPAPGLISSSGSFFSFVGRIFMSLFSLAVSTITNSSNIFHASSSVLGASSPGGSLG